MMKRLSLKHLKISQKLFISFLITSILVLATGLFGINNIGRINTNSEKMYQDMLLSISQLKDIEKNIMVLRGDLINLNYAKEKGDISTIMGSMTEVNTENKKEIEEFGSRKFSSDNKDAYEEFMKFYSEYDAIIQELDQASKDGKTSKIRVATFNAQVIKVNG